MKLEDLKPGTITKNTKGGYQFIIVSSAIFLNGDYIFKLKCHDSEHKRSDFYQFRFDWLKEHHEIVDYLENWELLYNE